MKTYTQKEVEEMLEEISPTPWKGVCVEYVLDCNGSMGYEMNDGNLIAAAPDLARQLLKLMKFCKWMGDKWPVK